MFTMELVYWLKDIEFFYNTLVDAQESKNPSKTYFNINPSSKRPKEGQVAYVNLRRGYPKEMFDGHYCYILKDFGMKYIVIPTTSVKNDSSPLNEKFEMDIKIKNFINSDQTRLQISDIRSIDIQRIKINKGVFEVDTNKEEIQTHIRKVLAIT